MGKVAYLPLSSASTGGGPILVVPSKVAHAWGGYPDDYDRACEPNDWIQTDRGGLGWLSVDGVDAFALDGELDTVWVPTSTGGIIVRGPEIAGGDPEGVVAVVEAATEWASFRDSEISSALWIFDSAAPGAKKAEDIDHEYGIVEAPLKKAKYHVELAQVGLNDLIRFRRVSTAKRPPKTAIKLPMAEMEPPASREWKLGEAILQKELPKPAKNPSGISGGAAIDDERAIGIHRGEDRSRQLMMFGPDDEQTPWSDPEKFSTPSLRPDRISGFAPSDTALYEFDVDKPGVVPVFESSEWVHKVLALSGTSVIVMCGKEVLLLTRNSDAIGTAFDISSKIEGFGLGWLEPVLDAKLIYVSDEDHAALIAVKDDALHPVEEFPVKSKRGLAVRNGRAFLYKPRSHKYEELLDLQEAWDEV